MKFKVGDFVRRVKLSPKDANQDGIIIRVYAEKSQFGNYPEVYDVEWIRPQQKIERGFLPHGLVKLT